METIILTFGTLVNVTSSETEVTLNLISDDKPSVTGIILDKTEIAEDGSEAILTATISEAHSKDVTIPLNIAGTATIETDYSTAFSSKGTSVLAGDNGSGSSLNQLSYPRDFSIDSSGNLYVADTQNNRIMKWIPGAIEGVQIANDISYPWGIHVDSSNNIYVSGYYNAAVYKYTYSDGTYTRTTVAGGNGNGNALNQLQYPAGIHVDSAGNVYVADRANHRIVKWEPGSSEGLVVAGGNSNGSALNQLNNPYGVTVDDSENVYVTDRSNSRIMKWASGSNEGVKIGASVSGNPTDLAIDSSGNIFVTRESNNGIWKLPANTQLTEIVVSGVSASGIDIDSKGNIYYAESNNNRIGKMQIAPEITITAGQTTGTVTFKSINEVSYEDDETIIITPSSTVTNATSSITDAQTITITDDDDVPSVSFAFSSPSIDEDSSTDVILTATLSVVSGKNIEIPFTV